jgi:uncharacterized membrane protein
MHDQTFSSAEVLRPPHNRAHKMTFLNIILLATAITTALIAGLFYSYSCSVNPGLGRLPNKEYLSAMQSINRAILNQVFFLSFMGTLLLLPVCTFLYRGQPAFIFLLLASLVYIFGVFGVTMVGNVPLNNSLDAFDLKGSSVQSIAEFRIKFEIPWNRLHTIRTIGSILSLVFVLIACIYKGSMINTK